MALRVSVACAVLVIVLLLLVSVGRAIDQTFERAGHRIEVVG